MNEEELSRSSTRYRGLSLKRWQLWIGVTFSLVFLALTLHNINLAATLIAISRVNGWILAIACVSYVLSIAIKALRWQLLLSAHKSPPLGRVFSVFSIGQMMNAFIPGHLGEFARAYLMGEAENVSKVYVLGTVAVERLADLLFLLISLALLLSRMVFPTWIEAPVRDASLVLVILVPFILLLIWRTNFILRIAIWLTHFAPTKWREWLVQQVKFGLSSLDTVRRPRLLAGVLVWSTIICFLSALTNYLVILSLSFALPVWSSLFLLVVLQLGTAIPSSPGRIGVFQYLVILGLSVFSADKNMAFGVGVLLYLVVYVPLSLIGIYCLWHEKITWKTLERAANIVKRLRDRAA